MQLSTSSSEKFATKNRVIYFLLGSQGFTFLAVTWHKWLLQKALLLYPLDLSKRIRMPLRLLRLVHQVV